MNGMDSMTAATDELQKLIANSAESTKKLWEIQVECNQAINNQNSATMVSLADMRLRSLREIAESKTFTQAFERHIAFEEDAVSQLQELYDENTKALTVAQEQVKALFSAASQEKPTATAGRKRATASK